MDAAPAGGPIRKSAEAGGAMLNGLETHDTMGWESFGGHTEEPVGGLAGGSVGDAASGGNFSELGGGCARGRASWSWVRSDLGGNITTSVEVSGS